MVKVDTDDRLVAKFDATVWYVVNGSLQFLTCLSFALGVDANARPIEMKIDRLKCGLSLIVLSNWNFKLACLSFGLGIDANRNIGIFNMSLCNWARLSLMLHQTHLIVVTHRFFYLTYPFSYIKF